MVPNPARGDCEVDLGRLGKILCRPTLRALEAIDDPDGGGTLVDRIRRLTEGQSLSDTVDIIYQTHLEGAISEDRRFTRDEIGAAVLEVGMGGLRQTCFDLVFTAWGPRAAEGEGDQGNG